MIIKKFLKKYGWLYIPGVIFLALCSRITTLAPKALGDAIDLLEQAVPDKDLVFVINSDNQFLPQARELLVDSMFDLIAENMKDTPVTVDYEQVKRLENLTADLKLRSVKGEKTVAFAEKINGKRFVALGENKMNIKEFSFDFTDGDCRFNYINAQGEKTISFGMCRNEFGKFPEFGYSDERGGTVSDGGFLYDCAASAAWREPQKLMMRVWITDKYLGNMTAVFAFKDDIAVVHMSSNAENFLKEYRGELVAVMEK